MTKKEIEKMVYERYPVTKVERDCEQERKKREYQRSLLKKRLMSAAKEKREFK